ncbi:nitrite reductase small subunit NirD [Thalassiella azotivora]
MSPQVDGAAGGAPARGTWVPVCALADLEVERGAAALVADQQVALFRLHDDTVRAVQHRDPVTGAHVLARGIVGSRRVEGRGDVPTVASPLLKQVYDLDTGVCLDGVGAAPGPLRTWPVRVDARGAVLVAVGSR